MIQSVRIRDFQSHKDTNIKLSAGFTIILGSNGCGKSAIIRAIHNTVFNSVGTSEVRWPDAKKYQIDILTNNNNIHREKGTGVNAYKINDGDDLIDVNRDVPKQVIDLLNIQKVAVDSYTDINVHFASQLDAPFLLSEKDSAKMKFLNMLSGTNAVDLAAKQANATVKKNNKFVKEATDRLLELEKKEADLIKKLSIIKQANKTIAKHVDNIDAMNKELVKFINLNNQYSMLQSAFKKLKTIKDYLNKADLDKTLSLIDKCRVFAQLKERYDTLKRKNVEIKNKKKLLYTIDFDNTLGLLEKYKTLSNVLHARNDLKKQYTKLKETINNITTTLENSKNLYIQKVKEFGVCPVCGDKITDEVVDNITQSL